MNKKQKNRKIIKQNKRNRLINRKYISTIKTLYKVYRNVVKEDLTIEKTKEIRDRLYSIIDKAVKKKVLHKNTAARKKQRLYRMSLQKNS
jgi:small subunit ribosomal protein S20